MKSLSPVVKTFLEIVAIDSITGEEAEMSNYVHKHLKRIGLKSEIDSVGNVICFVNGDKNKETLFLNAHLDTVEPGRGIEPYIDTSGFIRSRGSTILGADNKTAVAAILTALERLMEPQLRGKHNPLEVVFTVSEESGSVGAVSLDYGRLRSKHGYSSDASNRQPGEVIIASPFYNRFDLMIVGLAAHASKPEYAKNVLPVLSDSLSQLELGRVNEDTLVNIGIVRGGEVVNTIPGAIQVSGEVRSMVESDLELHTKKVVETFETVAERYKCKVQAKVVRENAGFKLDLTDPFLVKTMEVLNSMPNITAKTSVSWGCYDANTFAEHGITVLNIADGSQDSHTADERISVKDLESLVDIFTTLVTQ